MTNAELEVWVNDVLDLIEGGKPCEDSRVECKAEWVSPDKAARQLAGHANAAGGEPFLWIMGVDERKKTVCGVEKTEVSNWCAQIESEFDEQSPEILKPLRNYLNCRISRRITPGFSETGGHGWPEPNEPSNRFARSGIVPMSFGR